MPDPDVTEEQMRQSARLWWVPVCLGALSIIAGAIVLAKPDNSLKALAVIMGIFVLVDGLLELVMAFLPGTANRGLAAVLGTLSLIVGIVLIRHPIAGVQAVALFIGIWLIVAGVLRLVMAFELPGHRFTRIAVAVVEAGFGIAIVSSAHIGLATLALLVGLSFILSGFGMIAAGVLLRSAGHAEAEPPGPAVAA